MKIIGLSEKGARILPIIISWIIFLFLSIGYLSYANAGVLFQSETDNKVFLYEGEIKLGDAGFLTMLPKGATLYMHSPGGRFLEGLSMGYVIKAKDITVLPYKTGCYSSCAFAASMAKNINGKFHFHAPFNAIDKKIDPISIEIMSDYMRESSRFTEKDIKEIAITPHNKYYTKIF